MAATSASDSPVDLTIVGSGPGGYVAAIRASQLGLNTVLIEKDPKPGGTCLHRGCIPTKALLHSADVLRMVKESEQFGVVVEKVALDGEKVHKQKDEVVSRLAQGVRGLLKKHKVRLVNGLGRIVGPGQVIASTKKGDEEIRTRNILIATGSVPAELPIAPFDGERIVSSDHILKMKSVPESIVILGAGAVGIEFASIYNHFGSEVTIVELLPRLLPIEDPEVSEVLEKSFSGRGIRCLTEAKLDLATVDSKTRKVRSAVQTADGMQELLTDVLLVAVGRRAYTDGLGLENVGIELDRGHVPVNEWLETSCPGVYAIGDVIATPQLAHVASAEGILAVEKMAGRERPPINYRANPSCTYCFPEVASVGLTEPAAREQGYDVRIGKFPFLALGKAQILGDTEGFVKIVADGRYDEVLGVHIIGPHATDLIAEAGAAIQLESTVEELGRTIHPHPTLSESMLEAAHSVYGHGIHF